MNTATSSTSGIVEYNIWPTVITYHKWRLVEMYKNCLIHLISNYQNVQLEETVMLVDVSDWFSIEVILNFKTQSIGLWNYSDYN